MVKRAFFHVWFFTLILASACGAEFQVNTRVTYNQTYADVAMDAGGTFVVVWSSYRHTLDSDSGGIIGRRFDSNYSPVSEEFLINTTTGGNQTEPSAAMDSAGNFIVVWEGPGVSEEDIFGQRFDANGQRVGCEFTVNSTTVHKQLSPKVAMNSDGVFVVAWEREEVYGDLHVKGVSCQIYDSNGTKVGGEIQADPLTHCRYPDVAINSAGNFVVVWDKEQEPSSGCYYHRILGRQYNKQGVCITERFDLSTIEFHTITRPAIGMNEDGYFIAAWSGHPDPNSTSEVNVNARLYNPSCQSLTEQFIVNTTTSGIQKNPAVGINNSREFVILWNSETEPGISIRDIFGQRYRSVRDPVSGEFRVNTYIVDDQKYPSAVITNSGDFLAVWQSNGQDGSDYGIFGDAGPKAGCGDFSGDGFVNFEDYCVLGSEWLQTAEPLEADLIDDNRIDSRDLGAFAGQWLDACYQCSEVDIRSNGRIDFEDYAVLTADWLKQGPLAGDITGDGTVDMKDFKAMMFHWLKSCQ